MKGIRPGNKHPKKPFIKGDPRINRKGRPLLSFVIKNIRKMDKCEMTETFAVLMRKTKDDLEKIIENPQSLTRDVGIAKALDMWISTGDYSYVQAYSDFIFGKPVIKVDSTNFNLNANLENSSEKELARKAKQIISDISDNDNED
jgi:hypothetical protein